MEAARREIDMARLDDFTIDGFARWPAARARKVLRKNRCECRRHVLGDEHRETIDHGAEFGHQGHQRLRTAGR